MLSSIFDVSSDLRISVGSLSMEQESQSKARSLMPFFQTALLVDIQPDFMSEGQLPVQDSERILKPVHALMEKTEVALQVATQNWHPKDHVSFASQHPGRKPFDILSLHDREHTLWLDHCLQGSAGAGLFHGLPWHRTSDIVRKGMDRKSDSYSAFRNNWNAKGERPTTGLGGYLRAHGISNIIVCGLARDVYVKWTAEDGMTEGFDVCLAWDATRPVTYESDDEIRADLIQKGVHMVTTEQLIPSA